jgi:serine phosphatase RsbU (regulator of sigma subunit)/PAS domain-containing protein
MRNPQEDKRIQLASFPEQNPNPVVELDLSSGLICYLNPAAEIAFPDLKNRNIRHSFFDTIRSLISAHIPTELNTQKCEVKIDEKAFEQKLYYISDRNVLRIYSSDITDQKKSEQKLASLALFPEQNPNPVLEADIQTGEITYSNPAARRYFPDLFKKHSDHPLFNSIKKLLHSHKDFQCEVIIDEHTFEQKIYFLAESDLIRVYSTDISERKKTERDLRRLASFPEQNPSPIIELDLNGALTYLNPASIEHFQGIREEKLNHPVLSRMRDLYEKFKTKEIDHYSIELKYGDKYFTQRARFLSDFGVIRIFNLDITQQKKSEDLIREKNKDITDSINYARKIQQAILPSEDLLFRSYPDAFVLYQPKDIISGDFYWYHPDQEYLLFACADCTGHGVPGALMSMIGSNLITHIVNEKQVITPALVLTELDKRVRQTLKQDEEPESRDGMDISFCALQKEKRILQYAGANRPLAIIRNGKLTEYSPTKYAIGGQYNSDKQFDGNKIQLEKGDCIYLFTDGITDQFGGPLGKKLMKKRFYEVLTETSGMPLNEQKEQLKTFFNSWKNDLEQVDDVLVMGIRV